MATQQVSDRIQALRQIKRRDDDRLGALVASSGKRRKFEYAAFRDAMISAGYGSHVPAPPTIASIFRESLKLHEKQYEKTAKSNDRIRWTPIADSQSDTFHTYKLVTERVNDARDDVNLGSGVKIGCIVIPDMTQIIDLAEATNGWRNMYVSEVAEIFDLQMGVVGTTFSYRTFMSYVKTIGGVNVFNGTGVHWVSEHMMDKVEAFSEAVHDYADISVFPVHKGEGTVTRDVNRAVIMGLNERIDDLFGKIGQFDGGTRRKTMHDCIRDLKEIQEEGELLSGVLGFMEKDIKRRVEEAEKEVLGKLGLSTEK